MNSALLIEKFEKLSPGAQRKVVKNIEELLDNENENSTMVPPKPRSQFGDLNGFVKYIADDFDAPLEEFKDYM
jgi:hypothetical protein